MSGQTALSRAQNRLQRMLDKTPDADNAMAHLRAIDKQTAIVKVMQNKSISKSMTLRSRTKLLQTY